jgi:hypothetical protein
MKKLLERLANYYGLTIDTYTGKKAVIHMAYHDKNITAKQVEKLAHYIQRFKK